MPKELDNPYSPPDAPEATFQYGEFVIKAEELLCGAVVKLPKICLQTGRTEDVVEVHFQASDERELWKIRAAAILLAVVGIATCFVALQFAQASLIERYPAALFLPMIGSGIALAIGTSGWHFGATRVQICGYISKQRRRSMLIEMLMFFMTKLPLWLVFCGIVIGPRWLSIPVLSFADSWTPLVLMATAILCGHVSMSILMRHWKHTRQHGLVFKAKQLDNEMFLISGFSQVFLGALVAAAEMNRAEPACKTPECQQSSH